MKKLDLLVIPDEIASGIYEISKLLYHIGILKSGFTYDVVIDINVTKEILNSTKCIIFFRSRSVLDYQLAKLAKKLRKTTYLFIDDDFLGLKDDYGVNGAGIWEGRKKALKRMLPLVDAIISPNDLLCDRYAAIGNVKRKVRIDTSVDKRTLVRDKCKDYSRIALYINDGSKDMFDKYIRPSLIKLGELKPNFFTVDLLSLHPDCDDISGVSVNYVPHMTYPAFRKYLDESPIYIGLAPLDNNGFNQYKYFNKYIEYTRSGILGIYSDCPLYRQVIKNNENGVLVNNTSDAWAESILYCIDHPELYKKMLDAAQNMISDQFNIESICQRLIEALPELFQNADYHNASSLELFKIKIFHYLARFSERSCLLYRYLKVGGIRRVISALKHRMERNRELSK